MKHKLGLIILMVLAIAGVALSFYFFFKFNKANEELNMEKKKVEVMFVELDSIKTILQSIIENQNLDAEDQEALQSVKKANYGLYKVGLTSYAGNSKLYTTLDSIVRSNGFKLLWSKTDQGSKPSSINRIYFYSDAAYSIAEKLSQDFSSLLNDIEFEAIRGNSSTDPNRIVIEVVD